MKKIFINLILLIFTVFVVLFISEFAIRLTKIAYEPQFDNNVKITQPSPNQIIGYELIPGFEGQALGGFVSVNSFGFRGSEVSREKIKGVKRIAVLGDSWAFGWGVNQDEVVTVVLEKELNKFKNDEKFEVLNFSLFGYNLQQEEVVLKEKVLAFSPDIVIFAFNINDLEGIKQPGKYESEVKNVDIVFKDRLFSLLRKVEEKGNEYSHLFRLIDRTFRGLAIRFNIDKPGKKHYFNSFYEEGAKEFIYLQNAYQRISRLSKEYDFKVCVIYFPWMNELMQGNPYDKAFSKVRNAAEKKDFLTLNLFPFFEGQDVNKLRISRIDGHPTALGHSIAANAIAKYLLENVVEN